MEYLRQLTIFKLFNNKITFHNLKQFQHKIHITVYTFITNALFVFNQKQLVPCGNTWSKFLQVFTQLTLIKFQACIGYGVDH